MSTASMHLQMSSKELLGSSPTRKIDICLFLLLVFILSALSTRLCGFSVRVLKRNLFKEDKHVKFPWINIFLFVFIWCVDDGCRRLSLKWSILKKESIVYQQQLAGANSTLIVIPLSPKCKQDTWLRSYKLVTSVYLWTVIAFETRANHTDYW